MKIALFIPLLTLLLTSTSAFAAKFTNPFLEFDTPPNWQCLQEQGEWVCQCNDLLRKRDAIIVLAAKTRGPKDTMEDYQSFLSAPKTFFYRGKSVKSEKKFAKTENYNGQTWIDSMHLESELPGFFTRYLATIKLDIGVLVTFSVNKDKYQSYLGDFEMMIKSIKVFSKGASEAPPPANAGILIPNQVTAETVFPNVAPKGGADRPQRRFGGDSLELVALAALALGIVYWLWKKRRNS